MRINANSNVSKTIYDLSTRMKNLQNYRPMLPEQEIKDTAYAAATLGYLKATDMSGSTISAGMKILSLQTIPLQILDKIIAPTFPPISPKTVKIKHSLYNKGIIPSSSFITASGIRTGALLESIYTNVETFKGELYANITITTVFDQHYANFLLAGLSNGKQWRFDLIAGATVYNFIINNLLPSPSMPYTSINEVITHDIVRSIFN